MSRFAGRGGAFVVTVAGALLAVLASGRTWVSAPLRDVPGREAVVATGRGASPAAAALALVALAGAVALVSAGPRARRLVAAVVLLTGAGIAAAAGSVAGSPRGALRDAAVQASGTTQGLALVGRVHVGPWPVVAVAGGLLVALGGVAGLVRGGRWSGPSRRYDRAPALPSPSGPDRFDAHASWDALSRGDDPTQHDAPARSTRPPGSGAPGPASPTPPVPPGTMTTDPEGER